MAEGTVLVEAAGREIAVTSPSKVFCPERGKTKLDLVRYYLDKPVQESLIRAMQGRPVLLQRRIRLQRAEPASYSA
jgi:DNA primase